MSGVGLTNGPSLQLNVHLTHVDARPVRWGESADASLGARCVGWSTAAHLNSRCDYHMVADRRDGGSPMHIRPYICGRGWAAASRCYVVDATTPLFGPTARPSRALLFRCGAAQGEAAPCLRAGQHSRCRAGACGSCAAARLGNRVL